MPVCRAVDRRNALPSMFREAVEKKGRSRWDLVYAGGGGLCSADPFESRASDPAFRIPQGLLEICSAALCGAQHYCARMSFSALLMPLELYTPFMEDVGAVYLPAVVRRV